MINCDDLIEALQVQAREQVHLALLAAAAPAAAMHLDLALFSGNQARVADKLCEDWLSTTVHRSTQRGSKTT